MKKVLIFLGAPLPTAGGGTTAVSHDRVTDVKTADGFLVLNLDGGAVAAYNLNLIIHYSVDPHGSVLKPGPGLTV